MKVPYETKKLFRRRAVGAQLGNQLISFWQRVRLTRDGSAINRGCEWKYTRAPSYTRSTLDVRNLPTVAAAVQLRCSRATVRSVICDERDRVCFRCCSHRRLIVIQSNRHDLGAKVTIGVARVTERSARTY